VPQQKRPLLSIVIPVLEPDAELARCIHCILGALQGQTPPEIVVVTPPQCVDEITALFPGARVCAETRRGIYAAMNDGAQASRGDYLYFIGKDDMVLSTLRAALAVLDSERPFVLFCDVYWGARGTYFGNPSRFRVLARNLCHQGIVYSREAFDRHGPYLRRMRVQADHLLNIKILWGRSESSRIRYLNQPLAWYSGDGFSTLHRDRTFWRLYPTVMRRYVGTWAMCLLNGYRTLRGANRKT
jgi:glycosyltransferase involved in cell wall biosynthesis